MKPMRIAIVVMFAALSLSACSVFSAAASPTTEVANTLPPPAATLIPTTTLAPSSTPLPTDTPIATLSYPAGGLGPTNFPSDVDPLTGLTVSDTSLLDRRPLVIKVENLPREHRPQFGLSSADLIYEYYTEQGSTRFATVFYGQDAERVGPIRSGRFFDVNVVDMYHGIFIFGSAYSAVWNTFINSDFADRLVLENQYSCPALCRYEPDGSNLLVANTGEMASFVQSRGIDNARQSLDGMFFQQQTPASGNQANQVYVRFSSAIYNRWDYDVASGTYLRYEDAQNDVNHMNEVYTQLTDQNTGKPIAVENVVTLCMAHQYYYKSDDMEVVQMLMEPGTGSYVACDGQTYQNGSGPAWIARDGNIYAVTYQRASKDSPLTLVGSDGKPFPFKPGQTWFEVIGASSTMQQESAGVWRFNFAIIP
jgi:hypothetical protein